MWGRFGFAFRGRLIVLAWLLASVISRTAAAQTPEPASRTTRPLGFSNLVMRLPYEAEVSLAPEAYRVHILEFLRQVGIHAVGAENLVFGKDASGRAELVLGGTLLELDCADTRPGVRGCRIGIEWQLLDVASDRVVYKVLTRHALLDIPHHRLNVAGRDLVMGALGGLTRRQAFRTALVRRPSAAKDPVFSAARFAKCDRVLEMPAASDRVLEATVLVRSGPGFGSGFFVSGDGLLLTAAHVIGAGATSVKLRDGTIREVRMIRVARAADVALLALDNEKGETTPCLPLDPSKRSTGLDVYAVGSPATQDLAFSLTRGILSGVRSLRGRTFLQTDAAVSPGNSGGPLLDANGRAIGVVTWKLGGHSVEGLAFAIPIAEALERLGLSAGAQTDAALHRPMEEKPEPSAAPPIVDAPDAVPSLVPPPPSSTPLDRPRSPPWYVPTLRWGGVILASGGAIGILASASQYDAERTTEKEFQTLRRTNDVSWVVLGVGGTAFLTSFLIEPYATKRTGRRPRTHRAIQLGIAPSGASARVAF